MKKKTKTKMTEIRSLIAGIVIALAIGGGLGFVFGGMLSEQRIKNFVIANPQFIDDAIIANREAVAASNRIAAIGHLVTAEDGMTIMGNPDGDVTIYEFSDYNCGFCKRSLEALIEVTGDDSNVRVVVKEFPILSEGSVVAARYALAAARLGRYEEFHIALMRYQGRVDDAAVQEVVDALGIDRDALDEALQDESINAIITANRELAQQLEIGGTPAFIIGNELAPGAIPAEEMHRMIELARG